jgi:hypothetical protein
VPISPDRVDSVKLVTPSGHPVKLNQPLEMPRDHENDKVGITLNLSKRNSLGFIIRLIDLPEE